MVLRFLLLIILFANLSFAEELKTITAAEFLAQNPSSERKAIVDFMVQQFDGKKVSQTQLDELWQDQNIRESQYLLRFQIVNQRLYTGKADVKGLFFLKLIDYFQYLLKHYKIEDVDFLVYGRDELVPEVLLNPKVLNTPAFMMSKDLNSPYEANKFLFPDAHLFQQSWDDLLASIDKASLDHPWQSKENKIFWRGATTGWILGQSKDLKDYNINNFDKLPRLKLVMLSKLYPDLIDAEFVFYNQLSQNQDGKSLRKILDLLFGKFAKHSNFVNEAEHIKYKYLLSLDGNTCAWSRVPWVMFSNSVLLKQDSSKIEWFYPALKPYVHYVPINIEFTNLFEQMNWMNEHEQELQQISINAHNFVKNNLMHEHVDAHMAIILNEYAKIQQDKHIEVSLIPAEEVVSLPELLMLFIHKLKVKWFDD